MRVLVTGGAGFIGSHVVDRLAQDGHHPLILDRNPSNEARMFADVFLGDIRDANAVTEAVAHCDGVIHVAGVLGTQETIQNPRPSAEVNVLGGINVFEAVAQYKLPAVYIAVGNHWMQNTYSISKTAAERFAQMYNRERGTRIAIVRALNAYGEGQKPAQPFGPSKVRKIVPAFACRALAGAKVEVYGDGNQVMDMVYVKDVADVLTRALYRNAELGEHYFKDHIFEAGTGIRYTVNGIALAVIKACGSKSEIARLPMRPGEEANSVVLGNPATLAPLYDGNIPALTKLDDGLPDAVEYLTPWVEDYLKLHQ